MRADTIYVGCKDAEGNTELHALDSKTGISEWWVPTGPIVSVRVARGGVVWAITEPNGTEGYKQIVRIANGKGKKFNNVVFPVGLDSSAICFGSSPVYCRTDFLVGDFSKIFTPRENATSLAVDRDVVYVGDEGGYVYAVALHDGVVKWEARPTFLGTAAPIRDLSHDAGVLYVGSRGKGVSALDASTGRQKWTFNYPCFQCQTTKVDRVSLVGAKFVYVYAENTLYALRKGDGVKSWAFRFARGDFDSMDELSAEIAISRLLPPPTEAGRAVFVSSTSHIVELQSTTGVESWRLSVGLGTKTKSYNGALFFFDHSAKAFRGVGIDKLKSAAVSAQQAKERSNEAEAAERKRCRPVLAEIARRRMRNEYAMQYAMRFGCERLLFR